MLVSRSNFVRTAAAVLGIVAATAAPLPRPASAVTLLPLSPAGRVSVLTANINELLSGADIAETDELDHFAYRVQADFSGLNARGPAVPNYAPDLVLLQESTQQSAQNAANFLTTRLGYSYRVGASPNSGTGAWTVNSDGTLRKPTETTMGEINDTAILYNASTMNPPSTVTSQGLGYNKDQVNTDAIDPATGQPYYGTSSWLGMRQSIALISEKAGNHQQFAVASLHYRPNPMVKSPDFYKGGWTEVVKDRLRTLYPGAIPVAGGDLNMTPCYQPNPDPTKLWSGYSNCDPTASDPSPVASQLWTAFTTPTSVAATPTAYAPAYHPAFDDGIDHLFSTLDVLTAN
ncbi:MAG: hypothetical protein JO144_07595 [Actinobacteria bacterium]|nr:hypothetical protein [Actinomycetota bacterium]